MIHLYCYIFQLRRLILTFYYVFRFETSNMNYSQILQSDYFIHNFQLYKIPVGTNGSLSASCYS